MKRIKSLNLIRSVASLPIFIVLLVMLIGGSIVATTLTLLADSSNTKEWIEETGLYEEAPDLMVEYAFSRIEALDGVREGNKDPLRGLLSEESLRERVREAFPPEWVKSTVESVIDSLYQSLNNPGSASVISIDLTDREEKIREVLADVFKSKVASIPPCPSDVQGSLDEINLFEADCLPQNINKEDAYVKIDAEINTINPLSDNDLDEIQLGGPQEDTPIQSGPRNLISALPTTLTVFISIALLLHIILYLLFPGRKGKLIVFSALWGIAGVTLLLVTIVLFVGFTLAYDTYVLTNIPQQAAIAIPFIEKILEVIRSSVAFRLSIISLVFLVLSAVTIYRLKKVENVLYTK